MLRFHGKDNFKGNLKAERLFRILFQLKQPIDLGINRIDNAS